MANIKEVEIYGSVPFDCDGNQELLAFFGRMSLPSFGLRVRWQQSYYQQNEHAGQTRMESFYVFGQEALRESWFDAFMESVEIAGGCFESARLRDVENSGFWYSLLAPYR